MTVFQALSHPLSHQDETPLVSRVRTHRPGRENEKMRHRSLPGIMCETPLRHRSETPWALRHPLSHGVSVSPSPPPAGRTRYALACVYAKHPSSQVKESERVNPPGTPDHPPAERPRRIPKLQRPPVVNRTPDGLRYWISGAFTPEQIPELIIKLREIHDGPH